MILGDSEAFGDVLQRSLPPAGRRHDVVSEVRWIRLWHGEHRLQRGPRPRTSCVNQTPRPRDSSGRDRAHLYKTAPITCTKRDMRDPSLQVSQFRELPTRAADPGPSGPGSALFICFSRTSRRRRALVRTTRPASAWLSRLASRAGSRTPSAPSPGGPPDRSRCSADGPRPRPSALWSAGWSPPAGRAGSRCPHR